MCSKRKGHKFYKLVMLHTHTLFFCKKQKLVKKLTKRFWDPCVTEITQSIFGLVNASVATLQFHQPVVQM